MKKSWLLLLIAMGCHRGTVVSIDPSYFLLSGGYLNESGIVRADDRRGGQYYQATFYETNVRVDKEDFSFRAMTTIKPEPGSTDQPRYQMEFFFFRNGGVLLSSYTLSRKGAPPRNLDGLDWTNWFTVPDLKKSVRYVGYISGHKESTFTLSLTPVWRKHPRYWKLFYTLKQDSITVDRIHFHKSIQTQGAPYTEVVVDSVLNWNERLDDPKKIQLVLTAKPVSSSDNSRNIRGDYLKNSPAVPQTKSLRIKE
ncbi:MAG: hypothetical protein J7576_03320 [Siphonobacter aquaeclarae]|nr:hypothetical protein [Siphonobacter aquaeclarae]